MRSDRHRRRGRIDNSGERTGREAGPRTRKPAPIASPYWLKCVDEGDEGDEAYSVVAVKFLDLANLTVVEVTQRYGRG